MCHRRGRGGGRVYFVNMCDFLSSTATIIRIYHSLPDHCPPPPPPPPPPLPLPLLVQPLYRSQFRRQKRWWSAYLLFYERKDFTDMPDAPTTSEARHDMKVMYP